MIVLKSLLAGLAALVVFLIGLVVFLFVAGWIITSQYHGEGSVGWDPVSLLASRTGLTPAAAMQVVKATPLIVFMAGFVAGLVYFSRSH